MAKKLLIGPKCIYCLQTTGSFKSKEHIFPESLGNKDLILQRGYVCDRCNNGVLAMLDNALMKFEPIAFLQVLLVSHTKAGNLPKANFQNMNLKRTSHINIDIVPKEKSGEIQNKRPMGNDWYSFTLNMRGKPVTQKSIRQLARALFKIALGTVAVSQGREQACNTKYDSARRFILGEGEFNNNFFIKINGESHAGGGVTYKDLEAGTIVAIDIMGVIFLLNLEEKPILEFNKNMTPKDFEIYSLHTQ